jgi:hypothetical protein
MPRYAKVKTTVADGPISRTGLYELAGLHPGLFIKLGHSTLVNLDRLEEILSQLPPARIKAPAATREHSKDKKKSGAEPTPP